MTPSHATEGPEDPFGVPLILFRIGWMERYKGITGDVISSGGSYIADHGFGHEIFNFRPINGRLYGYVQPPGKRGKWTDAQINLTRLGAKPDEKSLSGVTAIWVATLQGQGAFVVGWYKNATIFRSWQPPPPDSKRMHKEAELGFYVMCEEKDAVLIPPDERVFSVPQHGRGGFGQANIWYADDLELNRDFRVDVLGYIATRKTTPPSAALKETSRQTDLLLRRRVEQAAIDLTIEHYTKLNYQVSSVERDNIGWDLEAIFGAKVLKLEVKGLAGREARVELTPNEYQAMAQNAQAYRLCIVTNALDQPLLEIFYYSNEAGCWKSKSGKTLNVTESVAARCSVVE